ncbi:NnrS family protein [Thalassospira sp. MCCC 1A01428]|uniref:NnrS family protein n=1 Tax=Thalassospira sp. MCCC 1A01428 TaxID=1470575 RepID=UPI000A1FAC76|nr:NnrS family protein [Thalassospira sp. MCCC 1A01428]OSQ35723.1 short-chain dehydrogenase [Thalassospira sp. MCCC 1A01428]
MVSRPIPILPTEPASAHTAAAQPLPIWRGAFRPLFLLAGLQAIIGVVWWLSSMIHGLWAPQLGTTALWHGHEMIFAFGGAALGGFLLTAIANWTGRPPLQGRTIMLLTLCWLAGRVAMVYAANINLAVLLVAELAYFVVLIALAARELIAGKNRRNLKLLAVIAILAVIDALFVLAAKDGIQLDAEIFPRAGIFIFLVLIALIGGRIIPGFTRNWLIRAGKLPGMAEPVSFNRFDALCMGTLIASAILAFTPWQQGAGIVLMATAVLHYARLGRWRGIHTTREPLVIMLHAAYFWLPTSLLLMGFALLRPDLYSLNDALHAGGAGAMACMIMAVGGRAALGHTGRALAAGKVFTIGFSLIWLATALRLIAPVAGNAYLTVLAAATLCWVGGWLLFVLRYAPILIGPPVKKG